MINADRVGAWSMRAQSLQSRNQEKTPGRSRISPMSLDAGPKEHAWPNQQEDSTRPRSSQQNHRQRDVAYPPGQSTELSSQSFIRLKDNPHHKVTATRTIDGNRVFCRVAVDGEFIVSTAGFRVESAAMKCSALVR